MLITAQAFTGTARMCDHWPVCMQYIVGPLIVVSVRRFLACPQWYQQRRGILLFPQRFHTQTASCTPRGRNPDTWSQVTWCMKSLWKQKTSSLELPSLLVPLRTCQESLNGYDNLWSDDVPRAYRPMHSGPESQISWKKLFFQCHWSSCFYPVNINWMSVLQ